jgi:hypothetical protein
MPGDTPRLRAARLAYQVGEQLPERDQLTIHADRGSPMTAKPVAFLLADPG